jgi:hypothetical protein
MMQSRAAVKSFALGACLTLGVVLASGARSRAADGGLIRSARSGDWSAPATWEGGKVPGAGARVQIRPGHQVVYDANSPEVIRAVFVGGTLRFAPDRDTRLDVGLLKIQAGEDTSEEGFDCDAHLMAPAVGAPKPTLEIGTPDRPIDAGHTALVRLTYVQGMDAKSSPAIVDCGGRMELHGQPMSRTWVKLAQTASSGAAELEISEPVSGWTPGDRLVITTTTRQRGNKGTLKASVRDWTQTEERILKSVSGARLILDEPLQFEHLGEGTHRAEVADLSRNVVVESADPKGVRGHTMYHRGSAGSISYAEFRHLGKEGELGRYSLHFHRVGDTMRGASVIGASIWDSANRWITIHGTNYLVVRDCVGYRSTGHGFFLEDGTEAYNVLDRNLAIQACAGKPLPGQAMPGDRNAGAGFWWSNSRNSFTRNVAAECDEYGYRFDAPKDGGMDLTQPVQQPDGSVKPVDIRTLPFIRFDDNESHSMRQHAFNLGGGLGAVGGGVNVGVNGVGPDVRHPFVIRNLLVWDAHWGFHAASPCVMVDGLHFDDVEYAMWRTVFNKHAYRNVKQERIDGRFEYYGDGVMPKESSYPGPLKPVDDLPPSTVITRVLRLRDGKLQVRGTTADNGEVRRVLVNGHEAKSLSPNFLEWEVMLEGADKRQLAAHAEDAAGNVEPRPHVIALN